MTIVPSGFVRARYKGVTRVSGASSPIPVILLQDDRERTVAIPMHRFEADLFHHGLQGNDEDPQPYRTLLHCLEKLEVNLNAVYILYTAELNFLTILVLQPNGGDKLEINVKCSEGIAYAEFSGAPIFIDEKIMAAISVDSFKSE